MKALSKNICFCFILVALVSFMPLNPIESNEKDVYSQPVYKMQEKLQNELWRNPIVFDNVGNNVYYVKPGVKEFTGATTFWKYNIDTNKETQISSDLKGRFAYPAISSDGRKLVCQFQKGNLIDDQSENNIFNQHVLLYCDLTQEPLKFVEISDENPLSFQLNEMMPEFSSDGSSIIYGSGKFFNVSKIDEFCHLRKLKIGSKEAVILLKNIESNKCFEFSPVIMNSNDSLISLMNIDPSSSNIGVFARNKQKDGKFGKIKNLFTPKGFGIFSKHQNMNLDASWISVSRFSSNIVCQAGGWNLHSIAKISINDEKTTVSEILKGNSKESYMHPCISSNGTWIAYEKCDIEMLEPPVLCAKITSQSIYIINTENLETKKIADNSMMPVFSPDMTQVVYLEKIDTEWKLKISSTGIKAEDQGILSREDLIKIEELVLKLGDDNYQTRENAKTAIMRFGKTALFKLKQLEKSVENPEIKYRLKEIIEFLESETPVLPLKTD